MKNGIRCMYIYHLNIQYILDDKEIVGFSPRLYITFGCGDPSCCDFVDRYSKNKMLLEASKVARETRIWLRKHVPPQV